MLFRQLEYFVAVAREEHFARAAQACHVSQPALSEAISKLERELGLPLIRRTRSFAGLTPEGAQLVLWARRLLADREAMAQHAAALTDGLTGDLRLGVIPAAVTTAAGLIDDFCAARPGVRVHLETGMQSIEVIERIRRFELDAGLIYPQSLDTADLIVTDLYDEELVLVGAHGLLREHGLTVDGPPAWNRIAELPLCLLAPGMRGRALIDDAAAAAGVVLEPRIESDAIASLLTLVAGGQWASIVPHTWLGDGPAGGVSSLSVPAAGAPVALVRGDVDPAPVLTAAFADHVASQNTWLRRSHGRAEHVASQNT